MTDAIILDNAAGTSGRITIGGATFTGPIPPICGEMMDRYTALLAGGVVPQPYIAPTVNLAAYAKTVRDAHENGGITVQGVAISTDDRSKTLIIGARLRAMSNSDLVEDWAAADGHVYQLPAAAIIAISDAIGGFISELFSAYASVVAGIAAGTITTTAQIDAAFGALQVAF